MRRLNMLKPKLFYQAKRNPDVEPLRAVLVEAIDEVAGKPTDRRQRFERFMELFEAILAYHRFHGGN
jgi:CRISPR-associated protein Csm2